MDEYGREEYAPEEHRYLNEERYQRAERKVTLAAILVLVIGLGIGGFLIFNGVMKPGTSKVEQLRVQLEAKKEELQTKGVVYDEFAKYDEGEVYELKVITKALDPSFDHCAFDEYKNNPITKEYCSARNSISDFASSGNIMIGVFICLASCMIAGVIFFIAKGRHIMAFQTQQAMPIAKEAIEEMAPTIGYAAGEIVKGIKRGLEDDDEE